MATFFHKLALVSAMMTVSLPLLLAACATVSPGPGRTNADAQNDILYCRSFAARLPPPLHDSSVERCLVSRGDTVKRPDGTTITPAPPQFGLTASAANGSPAPAANYPTFSTTGSVNGANIFLDDAMRADLKEAVFSNGDQRFNEQSALNNPMAVGNYFFMRNNVSNDNVPGGIAMRALKWSADKDIQDFVKARRWYQMQINFYLNTYPSLANSPKLGVEDCDFEISDASGSYIDQRKKAKEEADKNAKEREVRQIKSLLKKDIGDNLCDMSGSFIGQVEQVYNSKIQVRIQRRGGDNLVWHSSNDFYVCDQSP